MADVPPQVPDPSLLATESLLREVAHLRDLLVARVEAMDLRLEQRYVAQTEAVDAAFKAQQSATLAALAAADKAVSSALSAADQAVAKAEALNERRFESLNETTTALALLSDQVNELRAEVRGLDRLTDAKFVTFRTLVDSQAEKVLIALNSADKAVSKAEAANERRFDSVNEFRASLSDQATLLMPRTEATALIGNLAARLEESQKTVTTQIADLKETRAGNQASSTAGRQGVAYLFAAISALAALTGIALAVMANTGR